MDWGAVDWKTLALFVGPLLTGLLGGGVLMNLWLQRTQRLATRDEGFRSDLRRAHADFIASYLRFLHMGEEFEACWQQCQATQSDAIPEAILKAQQEYHSAQLDADTRLAAVLLLEDDPKINDLLIELYNMGTTLTIDKPDTFLSDLTTRVEALERVVQVLVGRFAPNRWDRGQRILNHQLV
jgi:hypothetical protein